MARIKELLDKQAKGNLTEAEAKELKELQTEAASFVTKDDEGSSDDTSEADDEAEVDKLADRLTAKVLGNVENSISKSMEQVISAVNKQNESQGESAPAFIVDKKFGRKSIEEASDIKVAIEGRQDRKYKNLSLKSVHFVNALYQGDVNKLQVLVEGTGARGGFLVPDDYANMIVEDLRDVVVMRQLADVLTTTSDTFHLPNIARRPQAFFRSEAAVKNTSTVDFGENIFTPYSLYTIVSLSNELVADASLGVGSSIVNYVTQVMVRSLAEREDRAFWTGSGSGEPTGVSTYTLGTMSGGITDVTRADAIKQTWARLGQQYRNRASWVMNASTLERVITLKDSQNNYLTSRIGDSQQVTLMGRPIYEQNDIAGGTVYFGDFSYYKIVDREGISVRVSDEATVAGYSGFQYNLTHVRVEKRVDGELTLTQPVRSITSMGNP